MRQPIAMFTIRARNMQYCGSVTISFVNESLPQRDDPLLRHEGYTTRVIVTSKACTWDRSSYVSLGGFHASSHGALPGSLIIAVCSHWKVVRDYGPLCGVNNVTERRPRRATTEQRRLFSLEILTVNLTNGAFLIRV